MGVLRVWADGCGSEELRKEAQRMPETEEELKELLDALKNDDDEYSEGDLDDITMDALLKNRSVQDLEWEETQLGVMLKKLNAIYETPSKMQALLQELNRRKTSDGRLRQTVLFTRFYDTLSSIRSYLRMLEPSLRVGIYAGGSKAVWYNPQRQKDCNTTHEEIKKRFLAGDIDLLLCTDAAAEGLNLQTADLLINFDLGWNPMKIEQRIGRIDRIGQKYSDIEVVNMCYVGSTEQVVYGRLMDRLQKANLIVGAQQISLLPVTQEEFRKLQTGEMTPEELETQSIQRLKKQKEANARMEMSAEDMYQMYSRMSEQMRSHTYPASVDDLWTCLTQSEYLKGKGARFRPDGSWSMPASDTWGSVLCTNQRETASSTTPFITWSNSKVESLLSVLGDEGDSIPYIKCIRLPGNQITAIAVSTESGVKLVTAYSQIDGLRIDTDRPITEQDILSCQTQLSVLVNGELGRRQRMQHAEQMNADIADLHRHFITQLTVGILKQMEASGFTKIMDAIKHLEANSKGLYYVDLPVSQFGGKASDFLFITSENAGIVHVTVRGILLVCVIEFAKREANAMRGRNSEKNTADVVHRLERR